MNNLVSLEKLKRVARQKGISKYYKEIGYSNVKGKKYYVITIDGKKVNFGSNKYQDFLTHHDKERRDNFRSRFNKMFEKYKNNYNSAMFWSYLLLW